MSKSSVRNLGEGEELNWEDADDLTAGSSWFPSRSQDRDTESQACLTNVGDDVDNWQLSCEDLSQRMGTLLSMGHLSDVTIKLEHTSREFKASISVMLLSCELCFSF